MSEPQVTDPTLDPQHPRIVPFDPDAEENPALPDLVDNPDNMHPVDQSDGN